MKSVWQDSAGIPGFETLKGEKNVEVCIIGGGMCGILCAYYLKQRNVNYILLEGEKVCSGITKNTTAKITSQHGLIYNKIIKSYGMERAKMYLEANQSAITKYNELSKKIDCDYEEKSAYTYSVTDREKIEREVEAVNSLGFNCSLIEKTTLPIEVKGAIQFEKQAQLNPVKFISGISGDLNITGSIKINK